MTISSTFKIIFKRPTYFALILFFSVTSKILLKKLFLHILNTSHSHTSFPQSPQTPNYLFHSFASLLSVSPFLCQFSKRILFYDRKIFNLLFYYFIFFFNSRVPGLFWLLFNRQTTKFISQ